MKICTFCKKEIPEDSAFEVCEKCGHQVWGEKMFNAIVENMEKAKEEGYLYQGSVTELSDKKFV